MNDRQRFRATLTFGRPDRLYLEPGRPRESTLRAWHQQGLPEGADYYAHLMQTLSLPHDPAPRLDLSVSFKMMPTFDEQVLEHRDGHYIVQDWMGAITEFSDEFDFTYLRQAKDFVTRKWHSFPVVDRYDWEKKIEWRYDPHQPGRFPADFAQRCHALRERDYPLSLVINGPFWQLREWCGFEHLCLLLVEQPDFVQEMVDFWTAFVLETLQPIVSQVELDYFEIAEDMAYKAHSMISPAMVRQFLLPTWQSWTDVVKASGCPVVCVDSDGYVAQLIPLWIAAGINCTRPMEVAAHNDIVAYRRQYGKQMAYRQGIDKRCLAAGGQALHVEVMRVVPPLLEQGGFLAGCDHGVPPDITWPSFIEFTRLLAQAGGWYQ